MTAYWQKIIEIFDTAIDIAIYDNQYNNNNKIAININ